MTDTPLSDEPDWRVYNEARCAECSDIAGICHESCEPYMSQSVNWVGTAEKLKADSESLRRQLAEAQKERDEFNAALDAHLCEYDKADWIGCAPTDIHRKIAKESGDEFCTVCDEDGEHEHAIAKRLTAAEQTIAMLVEGLKCISEWDALDIPNSDGPYWKQFIADLLAKINLTR